MKVLTAEDLGIAMWEGIDDHMLELDLSTSRHHTASPGLTEQQETFLRDRFGIKLEHPQTGRWVRSWRSNGE